MISWDRLHSDVQENDNSSTSLRMAIKSIEDHGCQCCNDDGDDIDECEGKCWPALSEAALKELCEKINELRAKNAALRAKMATMVCGTCDGLGEIPGTSTLDGAKLVPGVTYRLEREPCPVCQPMEGT